jgi:hypothetical protein
VEPIVEIENKGTNTLTSIQINYTIDNLLVQTYTWTGILNTGETTVVTMPTVNSTSGVHNFLSTIGLINGIADQNVLNNSKNKNFETAPSYGNNNYEFKLQLDLYPEEISWNLKNSSGVILYSGGNYPALVLDGPDLPALPALIVQNWILPNDNCYTFTINDSFGDGLLFEGDVEIDGYYSITSADGSTIVDTNDGFSGEQKIKNFNINSLSTIDLNPLYSIFVYPNPTKSIMTIALSDKSNLPDYFEIKNILGQQVIKKLTKTSDDLTFDTSKLTSGVYFITIVQENSQKIIQFIKE